MYTAADLSYQSECYTLPQKPTEEAWIHPSWGLLLLLTINQNATKKKKKKVPTQSSNPVKPAAQQLKSIPEVALVTITGFAANRKISSQ